MEPPGNPGHFSLLGDGVVQMGHVLRPVPEGMSTRCRLWMLVRAYPMDSMVVPSLERVGLHAQLRRNN